MLLKIASNSLSMTILLLCPYFMANQKKTVTLKFFVSRINQGVTALNWNQVDAFNYFKNALKLTAATWLDSWSTFNRDEVLDWEVDKPFF